MNECIPTTPSGVRDVYEIDTSIQWRIHDFRLLGKRSAEGPSIQRPITNVGGSQGPENGLLSRCGFIVLKKKNEFYILNLKRSSDRGVF